jgi:pimeloyl-ACP methyl ester carboxylesterase
MTTTTTSIPQGPLSAAGAPNLPAGFTDIFESRYVQAGDVRLHAVIGGDGPALLLVHGWPGSWYYWRLVMPALARDFTVIAVDQRGIGLSDKPEDGYDTATLANDVVALMDSLGHDRFALAGVDTGMLIAYAVAADHSERVERLIVGEAPLPGITPPTPLIIPDPAKARLWHIPFNQQEKVNEQLVSGREDIFFGAEFDAAAGTTKLDPEAVRYYVDGLRDPDALHGSFQMYRAFNVSAAQNAERKQRPLTMPVLAIGGEQSTGTRSADTMRLAAENVEGLVIAGIGHWLAEQAPEQFTEAVTAFLETRD